MTYDFDLAPLSPKGARLIFQWNAEAGTVSGPGAPTIRELASDTGIPVTPWPSWHAFSTEPLRSLTDMAAMVGIGWQLPAELAPHYPASEPEPGLAGIEGLVH